MKRKDGRELVTDHPVTAYDRIDYIPAGELEPPIGEMVCSIRRDRWLDDDFDLSEMDA